MLTDRHRKTKTNESWCSRPCRCTSVPLIICPSVLGCVYVPLSHSVEFGWPLILCRTLWRDRNKTQTVLLGSGQSTGRGTLGTVTSVVVSNTMPWEPEEEKRFSLKGMEEDKEGNDALYRQWWEKAMAPHSSTLAWKIPWMEEPGRLQSMGLLWVRHDCVTSLSLFTFMHWRRKWQPTPVFLPGESQGQGSLVGCCLWGRIESDMTEAT